MGDVAYDEWLIVVGYGFILEVVSRMIDMVVLWMESLVSVVRRGSRLQLALSGSSQAAGRE